MNTCALPAALLEFRHAWPSVDTRTLKPGDVFYAIRGEKQDGHLHAAAAIEKGAAAVVADHPLEIEGRIIVVPDTLAALQAVAADVRREWGGRLIAVTGSAGKTTTKEVIASLLSAALRVGKTEGNFNNHVGVPLSLLRMPRDAQAAVIEIGMNHAGEIRHLAAIAAPDIAVVTNVGSAHVENFESIEGVALAKRELVEALPGEGVAVLNRDDPRVAAFAGVHRGPVVTFGIEPGADVCPEAIEPSADGRTRIKVNGAEFDLPLQGRHGILNMLAGIAVARVFGIPAGRLRDAVGNLSPGRMRGEVSTRNGITFINDCYNSNPDAARAMLDVLAGTPGARRIAVLGEMLELGRHGERLHREVGRYAAASGIAALVGVRGAARFIVEEAVAGGLDPARAWFFDTAALAAGFLKAYLQQGDTVLFKASRGVALEEALAKVQE
jgi:UDP-N-acetylmuramoyl-tripeptide--D-alanyl-D-alanine ligase